MKPIALSPVTGKSPQGVFFGPDGTTFQEGFRRVGMGRDKAITRRYITPQAGCDYLSVSLRTMRTLLARGGIPYIQVGGKGCLVRLDINDLDEFMQKNKVNRLTNAKR